MPDDGPDPVQVMDDALKAFTEGAYRDSRKGLEDSVQRPADPVARKLTPQERRIEGARLLGDPAYLLGKNDEEKARFKLPRGLESRRVWEEVKEAVREAE